VIIRILFHFSFHDFSRGVIVRVPKFFPPKNGTFSFSPKKTRPFGKKKDTIKIYKNKKKIHYILNNEKFKHTKMSSKILI
jgi:hypothetical protein